MLVAGVFGTIRYTDKAIKIIAAARHRIKEFQTVPLCCPKSCRSIRFQTFPDGALSSKASRFFLTKSSNSLLILLLLNIPLTYFLLCSTATSKLIHLSPLYRRSPGDHILLTNTGTARFCNHPVVVE